MIQRALGTKNLSRAKWSFVLSGPLSLVTQVIAAALGLVVFSYYANRGCDPVINGDISRADQIIPLYFITVIDYPTVGGFFYAAVICASLSTISSSINAVTAIIWDDVLVTCFKNFSELKQSFVRKVVSVVYGFLLIGGAFILEENKENTTLISFAFAVFGALQGPVLGMFLFAAFLPFTNGVGAFTGGLCAAVVTTWMMAGRISLGLKFQILPLPKAGCIVPTTPGVMHSVTSAMFMGNFTDSTDMYNISSFGADMTTSMMNGTTPKTMLSSSDDRTDLEWFYSISFWYYAMIAVFIVFLVGTVVSLLTWRCTERGTQKKYLFPIIRSFAGQEDVSEFKNQESKF